MFAAEGAQTQGYMVVGATGSGKSTWLAQRVRKYQGNVIVYKHLSNIDDAAFAFLPLKTTSNWRQGAKPTQPVKCRIGGMQGKEYTAFLKWVTENYRNGALIIDDATIFERDRLSKELNFLLTMKRHLGLDIFMVYHGLTLQPIEQFLLCRYLILFNTTDNVKYKMSKIPRYDEVVKGIQMARDRHKSSDPKVKYSPVVVRLE